MVKKTVGKLPPSQFTEKMVEVLAGVLCLGAIPGLVGRNLPLMEIRGKPGNTGFCREISTLFVIPQTVFKKFLHLLLATCFADLPIGLHLLVPTDLGKQSQ